MFIVFMIPFVSSLQINDTTFFASQENFTIFVDSIILDAVVVTNQTIEFHNLTSIGSNFTNSNATFDARADFFGLDINLIVRNKNTSTDLFTSTLSDQNFNVTFTSGQVIIISENPIFICTQAERNLLDLVILFFALAILMIPLILLVRNGNFSFNKSNAKRMVTVFVGILIGLIFLIVIANSIQGLCG